MTEENDNNQTLGNRIVDLNFQTTDGDYARLMLKLRHEEMTKKAFFLGVMKGFLEDDPDLKKFLKTVRHKAGYAKWKEELLDKEIEDGKKEMRKFSLDDDEIEDIYDLFDEEAGL